MLLLRMLRGGDGCNTANYVGKLHGKDGKDTKALDLEVATSELDWGTSAPDVLTIIDGVTGGQSINEMESKLEALNKSGSRVSAREVRYFAADALARVDIPTVKQAIEERIKLESDSSVLSELRCAKERHENGKQ